MEPRGNGFNNYRGRGHGRGRGASPFRGQSGRGHSNRGRGTRGRGHPTYRNLDIIDVDIQRYADATPTSGTASPMQGSRGRGGKRGRGRGRGISTPINLQVYSNGRVPPPPPRQEDWDLAKPGGRRADRGPSRGLGARYNPDIPLSKLLAMDRPYLRPINFVPAQLTPVLFEREEELIEVHEFKEPEDHVPTAEQVSRVFSQQESQPPAQDSFFQDPGIDLFADAESEPVVTVDFSSLEKLLDDASTPQTSCQPKAEAEAQPETAGLAEPEVLENGQATNIFATIMQALSINNKEDMNASSTGTAQEANVDHSREHSLPSNEENISITPIRETTIEVEEPRENRESEHEEHALFVMDVNPTQPSERKEDIKYTPVIAISQPLGIALPDDDEIIVYDAPLPRSGRATPNISPGAMDAAPVAHNPLPTHGGYQDHSASPSTSKTTLPQASSSMAPDPSTKGSASVLIEPFAGMSFSFDAISRVADANRQQTEAFRARRLTKRDRQNRAAQWKGKRRSSFGTFGAMLEEMHLHDDELALNETRGRREDSDIDWGDGDSEVDIAASTGLVDPEVERVSSGLGGMDIDGGLDIHAMQSFVNSMSNKGMEHTRIDDIEDAEKLQLEDKEEDKSSSGSEDLDSEVEAVVDAEEELMIGEANGSSDSDSGSDDDSEDDDETPMQNFQARLTQMRQSAKAKGKMKETAFSTAQASNGVLFSGRMTKLRDRGKKRQESEDDDDYDDSDDFGADFTWAEQDEDYLADLQDLLDEDESILVSDRKQRKALFKAVLNGEFNSAPAKKKRDYGKDLPPELRAQWERDRAKKAENKRKRAAARLEVAADPFAKHKGGKKGRKAMLRAARLAEEAREEAPRNAGPDISLIVRQMRAYLDNLSVTSPMALPPMDKESRSKVHEIADAFGLKSQSKGKGTARYTTIIKTSRSGIQINERKIQRILGSGGDWGSTRPGNPGGGRGKAPKHKEGDEVGKAAPKIGESNIGFKMLANMGWAEGEKIGVSGGLDAPLKAVFKSTKLGLGATR